MGLPSVGLGTGGIVKSRVTSIVELALSLGYRLVDTAEHYGTEVEVGQAIKASGVDRSSLFVITKYWGGCGFGRSGHAEAALNDSLRRLQLDYVDAYLVHMPAAVNDRVQPLACKSGDAQSATDDEKRLAVWRQLEAAKAAGRVRCIGVSNWNVPQMRWLLQRAVAPDLFQGEFHPHYQPKGRAAFLAQHRIALVGYGPVSRVTSLAAGSRFERNSGVTHSNAAGVQAAVKRAASTLNRSSAALLLRWAVDHGATVIPRSTSHAHLRENLAVAEKGFVLPPELMAVLDMAPQAKKGWGMTNNAVFGDISESKRMLTDTPVNVDTDWPQLIAHSVPELLASHADPFGALLSGSASAVVLREWLPRSKAEDIATRLWSLKKMPTRRRGVLPGEHNYETHGAWVRPGGAPNHYTLGPDLLSYIAFGSPMRFANATRNYMRFISGQGFQEVYDALQDGLAALSRRRTVRVARHHETGAPFSPGIFRANLRGHSLSMHADTLHAHETTSRVGCPYRPPRPLATKPPPSALYPDMYRFEAQLSALLLLRNGDARATRQHSTTVHDVHWRSCHYEPQGISAINVAVDERRFRRARRATNLTLGAGDLYIFNSNNIHQVLPTDPGPGRLTLGTFVGIDEQSMHIWA